MNIWWPVQYAARAVNAISRGTVGVLPAILGGRYPWNASVPSSELIPVLGFNIQIIGFILLAIHTAINLWYVSYQSRVDRKAIIIAAVLQVYAYFILRVGVQNNHYFILVPILALICCESKSHLKEYLAITIVFLVQDLLFYGLGTDFNYGIRLLSRLYLGWTVNLLALANVMLFSYLCWTYFRTLHVPLVTLRDRVFSAFQKK